MTDLQILYFVLVCCYLMECCVLVDGVPAVFMRLPLRWRVLYKPGLALWGNQRLIFLNPLPWLTEWRSCESPSCTLTAKGIVSVNSWIKYSEMPVHPALFAPSSPKALAHAEELCKSGYPGATANSIPAFSKDNLRAWANPTTEAPTTEILRKGLWYLKFLCSAQFFLLFFVAPVLVALYPPDALLLPYGATVYWLNLCIALAFAEKYQKLCPGKRWGFLPKTLWMLLYPINAIRAVQILCAPLRARCHESALAHSLLPPKERAAYLATSFNRLRYQNFSRSLTPEALTALALANHTLRQVIEKFWKFTELAATPEFASASPHPEPTATRFCPLCGISFTDDTAFCPHCLEVRTLPARPQKSETPR